MRYTLHRFKPNQQRKDHLDEEVTYAEGMAAIDRFFDRLEVAQIIQIAGKMYEHLSLERFEALLDKVEKHSLKPRVRRACRRNAKRRFRSWMEDRGSRPDRRIAYICCDFATHQKAVRPAAKAFFSA